MSDGIRVFYEGDDDREVLSGLGLDGLLVERRRGKGRDVGGDSVALAELAGQVELMPHAIVVLDRDDASVAARFQFAFDGFMARGVPCDRTDVAGTSSVVLGAPRGQPRTLQRFAVVLAGLGRNTLGPKYPTVTKFAIDDYILRLLDTKQIYDAIGELSVSYETAWHKLDAISKLMSENGVPIAGTKRLLHVLRAIAGFRASPAAFAKRVLEVTRELLGDDELRRLFEPLVSDLLVARDHLLTAR
jgi:hypothetical protein